MTEVLLPDDAPAAPASARPVRVGTVDAATGADADVSVVALLGTLLRRWRLVAACALAGALLAAVAVLVVKPRTYTAGSTFFPQSKRGTGNLTALAAQFGVAVPGSEPGQSPDFYASLIKMRNVLSDVASGRYATSAGARVTLAEVFRVTGRADSLVREAVLERLDKAVAADVDLKTGTVQLRVTTRDAAVSRQVNDRILDYVNAFNLHSRQTQAAAERRFTEGRLEQATAEQLRAENQLLRFLQSNREYRNSPELNFEQDRLAREVSLRQQVRGTLAQALEQAKIDEVRDTPVITVVERATVPVLPDRRGAVKAAVLGLLAGAAVGVLLAVAGDAMAAGVLAGERQWVELDTVRRTAGAALRRPLRGVRRDRSAGTGAAPV